MNSKISAKRFTLEVELLEDLHSGTGTGGGAIDSIQARDRHGHPVIRGTHLKGVLRSAAEELNTLKPETFTKYHIEKLFGTIPIQSGDKLDTDSQETTPDLPGDAIWNWSRGGELVVGSLSLVKEGRDNRVDTLLWSSTSRKINSRAPQDDTLRSVEFIPAGAKFVAEVRFSDPGLSYLLEACVRRTDRLGSSRSRGAGLVKMALKPVDLQDNSFENYTGKQNKVRLRLLLRNQEPLCLPVTGVPGNIIRTESYIRGQVLSGALSAWALQAGKQAEIIFDRRVSVGNALPLPVVKDLKSNFNVLKHWDVLPIPLSVQTPKIKPSSDEKDDASWPHWTKFVTSYSILTDRGESDSIFDSTKSPSKPKRPGDREFLFRQSEKDAWVRFAPEVGYHLRNQVPNVSRKTADEQKLFAEEEIAEKTYFHAEICFYDKTDITNFCDNFLPVLNGSELLRIGRGGRPVTVVKASWIEVPGGQISASTANAQSLTITLESDLIARSSTLGFFNGLDCAALKALTGLSELDNVDLQESYGESVEVRGFNAASGLPRAPVLAIRRGSVFRLTGKQIPILAKFLITAQSEMKWLGERTWEGFGRFRIDFNPIENQRNSARKPPAPSESFTDNPEEAVLRKSKLMAVSISSIKPLPSKSQWQFLRNNALAARDLQSLQKMLDELSEQSKTTKAGEVWKIVLPKIRESLKDDLVSKDVAKARLFLDTLVRWVIVEKFREKNQ